MRVHHCDKCKQKHIEGEQYAVCPHKLSWSKKEWELGNCHPMLAYTAQDYQRIIGYLPIFAPSDPNDLWYDPACTNGGDCRFKRSVKPIHIPEDKWERVPAEE